MFWPILFFFQWCVALPVGNGAGTLPSIRQLSQFPNETWVENLAVRSNGRLLVTIYTSPDLYEIDPIEPTPTPKLVAKFPDALGIVGIAEIEEDVFAIAKGNASLQTGVITPNSMSVWKADLQNPDAARLSNISDLPEAQFLNGLTQVKKGSNFILVADSVVGVIWRINTVTSKWDVALNDTTLKPTASIETTGFGVNGVHTKDGYLYYTNTNRGFYRVPINDEGTPTGKIENLATFINGDDFTFDERGNVYIARGRSDLIGEYTTSKKLESLAFANSNANVLIEGNTAMKFGRTKIDKSTLYVTTNGGMSGLVNGTKIQGGRVLAIDIQPDCGFDLFDLCLIR